MIGLQFSIRSDFAADAQIGDDLFDAHLVDQAKRRELFGQVFNAIATDLPVVFLYYSDYLYAQSKTLKGFRVAPVNDPTQRFWNVEEWYVKTAPRP